MDGSRAIARRRTMFQALIPARRLVRTMHVMFRTVGTTYAMLLRRLLRLMWRSLDLRLLLRRAL